MGGCIRGILLDSSALLADDVDNGNASLLPGADSLLRRLRYSNIPTGICYRVDLSACKVTLLERMATLYSFEYYALKQSSVEEIVSKVALAFGDSGGSFLYVVSKCNKDQILQFANCGGLIIILNTGGCSPSENPSMSFIDKLDEMPLTICNLHKKALGKDKVTVGYLMKASREEDFAKRGAFPLSPTENGLMFLPLTFELPLQFQLQQVDVVLHKATDEIVSIEMNSSSEVCNKIIYNSGMQELQRLVEHQPEWCLIDPFNNIYPVLDRLKIQQLLLGLENCKASSHKIRGPHFLKVDNFDESNLVQRLVEAKLFLPTIVKPQVACGVADAHSMAIVFNFDDYKGLSVPLPALVQEYVDHSSSLFKFYVLGEKIFYAVKKSTPNRDVLIKLSERNGPGPLLFDSLKSLPVDKENQHLIGGDINQSNDQLIDLGLVTEAASWLRKTLDLTIFGFDVVVQDGTGDHVIVDVNYLPSFKEVPDDIAIPAFWDAIKKKFESRKLG